MKKILMLRGLPASGKTTFAKELLKTEQNWKRINKDDLRAMLDNGKWSKTNESFVLDERDRLIQVSLEKGFSVVVDDTNLHTKHEARLRQLATENSAEFEIKDFDLSPKKCVERDALRPNGVGKDVIWRMWKDHVIPRIVWPADRGGLAQVVLCDLDGTLADLDGRDPYDASTCGDDKVHEDILEAVKRYDMPVIFVSGRSEVHRAQTLKWLNALGFKEGAQEISNNIRMLKMRKEDDTRPDWLVKFEILRDEIAPYWNPVVVFDDRDSVVAMWRAQGLRVFQVADGNF